MTRKTLMKALSVKSTFIMTYRQISGESTVYVSMKISRMELTTVMMPTYRSPP